MRHILLIVLSLIFCTTALKAQSPEAFKYQAVAKDAGGQILANQPVSFQISILQESPSGPSVYSEFHTATTTNFGLVNLEIGHGNVASGDFQLIDWGADIYFVQIEMDETGGSNYQLMGTSQLLSVAYALHAKTADYVPGDGDTDSTNEIELPAGGTNGQVLTTNGTGDYSWTENGGSNTQIYEVGDLAHGGIVFYVDPSGTHGLVAANIDQHDYETWYDVHDELNNPDRHDAAGKQFFDWRLPSRWESTKMYTNLKANGLGDFDNFGYWIGNEFSNEKAWCEDFFMGGQIEVSKTMNFLHTRAVRAF